MVPTLTANLMKLRLRHAKHETSRSGATLAVKRGIATGTGDKRNKGGGHMQHFGIHSMRRGTREASLASEWMAVGGS